MKTIFNIIIIFNLISCNQKLEVNEQNTPNSKLELSVEKILIFNTVESNAILFKLKVKNLTDKELYFVNRTPGNILESKKGFYIESTKEFYPLVLSHDDYVAISPSNSDYYFLYKKSIKYGNPSEKNQLKNYLANFKLKYNGKIKDDIKNTDATPVFQDSLEIFLSDYLEIKYIDSLPIRRKDWNNL